MPAKPSQRAGKNDFRASFTVVELLWNEKLAKCKVFIGNALHTFTVIPGDQTKGHRIVPKLTLFGEMSVQEQA